MSDTVASLKLTYEGAMKLLQAAIATAGDMGVPQLSFPKIPSGWGEWRCTSES